MKFSVSSSALLKQVTQINGVIMNNPVMPILENFLFDIKDGILSITASDLQITMITALVVDTKEDASICVPAKILLETLRNLPEQPITFYIDHDSFTIELSSETGRYKLAGENAIDFPKIPTSSKGDVLTLPADVLHKAIVYTIFSTGTDELRPAMMGVLFQIGENDTTFVATDGHRLSRYKRMDVFSENTASLILPKKALNLLKSSLPNDSSTVTLSYTTSNAFFSFNNVNLICRLIDERYPDYEVVIPVSNPNSLSVQRLDFLNALKRVSIYSNKTTNQVRLKINEEEVQISAEDIDFNNEAAETIAGEYEGESIEIGFTAKYLIEMVNFLEGAQISVELMAPNKPGLLIPKRVDEGEEIMMLIMPVMLNQYV
ncbi:MAG: DNA polymerase III subunit beta [candidate division WS2 bacterium]|uniref:Beta sliding clamp n=1 Tax=Psychracetigena formicireducens TaxID=2986056 RepID=A0A9E2BIN6_PSYF1|nr:DNA polymerase III subunit beta [Candidatus Psychracetigena formicireducens]